MTKLGLLNDLKFIWMAWRCYQRCVTDGQVRYCALMDSHGFPVASITVATGRESWRISVLAIEAKAGMV